MFSGNYYPQYNLSTYEFNKIIPTNQLVPNKRGGTIIDTLNVKNLYYTYQSKYQKVHALKDVNYTFTSGKFYAIEGSSGSGKTTFLSLLAGLDKPEKGEIKLNGVSYCDMSMEKLRREQVSVIFQNFNLFPLLTVQENIMYPMQLLKRTTRKAKEEVYHLIKKVGLKEELLCKFPPMLSGGEQQRVAIARSLASGAKIILADEPTGNLDSENSKRVVGILKNLVMQNDYCVILVTHDRSISEQADIVIQMKDGMIVK